jgi:threonine dehydrogenase-like Zn-dependent dehydrogenase
MKGVVFLGDRKAVVKDFPDPEPGFGQVRVRMKATGICGSDLHVYRREAEHFKNRPDRIPGHEPSGVVEAVGEGVEQIRVGDRVCINHYLACGHCKQCASGYFQWCAEAKGYGGPIDGSHADFVLADERNCVIMPESVSFTDGAFIACAGGTAYSAMRKLDVSGNTILAVFGLGPVGLSGVLVAKAMGGLVVGVDVIDERVELAKTIGADVAVNAQKEDVLNAIREIAGADGCDLAFEASGSSAGRVNAVKCLRRGGKAAFVGVGNSEPVINPTEIIGRELTLMGSYVLPLQQSYDLVNFLERRKLSFSPIVTHQFPIEDGVEAYRAADGSRTGKVVFAWDE